MQTPSLMSTALPPLTGFFEKHAKWRAHGADSNHNKSKHFRYFEQTPIVRDKNVALQRNNAPATFLSFST